MADIGDVSVNLYNLVDCCRIIKESYLKIMENSCIPLTAGWLQICRTAVFLGDFFFILLAENLVELLAENVKSSSFFVNS